jgi:peptidoglycan hydrolase-like protein with peptidoglycan-binding domain
LAPTPDRYKEIQNALATKGYLKPEEATGTWSQSSTDAMKRFQADQNIEASGKVTAMALIALGLGAKHEAAAVKPPDPR